MAGQDFSCTAGNGGAVTGGPLSQSFGAQVGERPKWQSENCRDASRSPASCKHSLSTGATFCHLEHSHSHMDPWDNVQGS